MTAYKLRDKATGLFRVRRKRGEYASCYKIWSKQGSVWSRQRDLIAHLKLHGISNPEERGWEIVELREVPKLTKTQVLDALYRLYAIREHVSYPMQEHMTVAMDALKKIYNV